MTLDSKTQFFGDYIHATVEIELLRQYIKRMDSSLLDAEVACASRVQAIPEALNMIAEDEKDLIFGPYSEILNASFIISVAIFLEKQLGGYSYALQQAGGLELGLNDLSGSLSERFRKYCLHIARLPLLTSDSNWQDIRGFMEIRNCLVHKNGQIDGFGKAEAVKAFIGRHGTPVIEDGRLMINADTSQKCIDIVQEFTESIYDVALKKYPSGRLRYSNRTQPEKCSRKREPFFS